MEEVKVTPKMTTEQKLDVLIKEVMRLLQLRGDMLEIANLKAALGEEA